MRVLKISQMHWVIIICMALLFQNCSSDDGGNISGGPGNGDLILEAIVGDWIATSAMFTTTNANPVQTTEVVADGGYCDLSVSQDHRFTVVVRNPGVPNPQITTGNFVSDGNNINVKFDTDPNILVPWNFSITGDNLTIDGLMNYDFENDGTFEDVSANMQFIPN